MTRSLHLFSLLSITVPALALAACIPDYSYDGDYAMTYAIVAGGEATAGTTEIHIRQGLADDIYKLDLGESFCQLTAKLQTQQSAYEAPYLEIAAQPCWHAGQALSLAGTASWDDDAKHLAIELAGSTLAAGAKPAAPTTVQFTETW